MLSPSNLIEDYTEIFYMIDDEDVPLIQCKMSLSISQVKVTLRLTVSESVSLGVEPHLSVQTSYLILHNFDTDRIEITTSNRSYIVVCVCLHC
jgi:hypothetical protein